jgi:hypothetical protein
MPTAQEKRRTTMKSLHRFVLSAVLLTASALISHLPAQSELTPPSGEVTRLDDGQLDPAWFVAGHAIEFRATRVVDYLWVKPGLDLKGRKLHLERWEPATLGPKREEIDRTQVVEMTQVMPSSCQTKWDEVFKGDPACSLETGDIRVVGRFVDMSVPSSFWSAAWATQTFDLKLVDKATGDLLVAMHHRVVGGRKFQMKATMERWCGKVAEAMNEGLEAVYAAGKKAES